MLPLHDEILSNRSMTLRSTWLSSTASTCSSRADTSGKLWMKTSPAAAISGQRNIPLRVKTQKGVRQKREKWNFVRMKKMRNEVLIIRVEEQGWRKGSERKEGKDGEGMRKEKGKLLLLYSLKGEKGERFGGSKSDERSCLFSFANPQRGLSHLHLSLAMSKSYLLKDEMVISLDAIYFYFKVNYQIWLHSIYI